MSGDDFHNNFQASRVPGGKGSRVQGFKDIKAEELGTSQ
jgi:hypothetical protein